MIARSPTTTGRSSLIRMKRFRSTIGAVPTTKSARLIALWTISTPPSSLTRTTLTPSIIVASPTSGEVRYDLAIKDFDQVLKLNPNDADAIRDRADALARKSKQPR